MPERERDGSDEWGGPPTGTWVDEDGQEHRHLDLDAVEISLGGERNDLRQTEDQHRAPAGVEYGEREITINATVTPTDGFQKWLAARRFAELFEEPPE